MVLRVTLTAAVILASACGGGQSYDDGKDGLDKTKPKDTDEPIGPASSDVQPASGQGGNESNEPSVPTPDGGGGAGTVVVDPPASGGGGQTQTVPGGSAGDAGSGNTAGGPPTAGGANSGGAGGAGATAGAGGAIAGSGGNSGGAGGRNSESPCAGAMTGAACDVEGQVCINCSEVCSFCGGAICSGGTWQFVEAAPEPCFECGADRCSSISQYCELVPGSEDATCLALPRVCAQDPTCECFESKGVGSDLCANDSGGITVQRTQPTRACVSSERTASVYAAVASGCEPACQVPQTCHERYQQQQVDPQFVCVDPATIAPPTEVIDDSLVCEPNEICLTHATEDVVTIDGEPFLRSAETGRCVARSAACLPEAVACDCVESTCSELFDDQNAPGQCLASGESLWCLDPAG